MFVVCIEIKLSLGKIFFLKCHNWQKITNFNNSDNEIEKILTFSNILDFYSKIKVKMTEVWIMLLKNRVTF